MTRDAEEEVWDPRTSCPAPEEEVRHPRTSCPASLRIPRASRATPRELLSEDRGLLHDDVRHLPRLSRRPVRAARSVAPVRAGRPARPAAHGRRVTTRISARGAAPSRSAGSPLSASSPRAPCASWASFAANHRLKYLPHALALVRRAVHLDQHFPAVAARSAWSTSSPRAPGAPVASVSSRSPGA